MRSNLCLKMVYSNHKLFRNREGGKGGVCITFKPREHLNSTLIKIGHV